MINWLIEKVEISRVLYWFMVIAIWFQALGIQSMSWYYQDLRKSVELSDHWRVLYLKEHGINVQGDN